MNKLQYLQIAWRFPFDLVMSMINESHRSHFTTYVAMRKLYVFSKGRSRLLFRAIFKIVRKTQSASINRNSKLISNLKKDGITILKDFITEEEVLEIREYLKEEKGIVRLEGNQKEVTSTIESIDKGVKLQYSSGTLLSCEKVVDIISHPLILQLATDYLGCTPVFAGVSAWWSLCDSKASEEDFNWAAQKYHFDYDYPCFVKFFIYLTDVGEENGPFMFIEGTHENKLEWQDGRLEDSQINAKYREKIRCCIGSPGDLIVADTAGYHKGSKVLAQPRLMLQLEFSVSLFGGGALYELLPKSFRPSGHHDRTFDLFSG